MPKQVSEVSDHNLKTSDFPPGPVQLPITGRIRQPEYSLRLEGNTLVLKLTEDIFDPESPVYEVWLPITLVKKVKDG